jgi:hypothetical protein
MIAGAAYRALMWEPSHELDALPGHRFAALGAEPQLCRLVQEGVAGQTVNRVMTQSRYQAQLGGSATERTTAPS